MYINALFKYKIYDTKYKFTIISEDRLICVRILYPNDLIQYKYYKKKHRKYLYGFVFYLIDLHENV